MSVTTIAGDCITDWFRDGDEYADMAIQWKTAQAEEDRPLLRVLIAVSLGVVDDVDVWMSGRERKRERRFKGQGEAPEAPSSRGRRVMDPNPADKTVRSSSPDKNADPTRDGLIDKPSMHPSPEILSVPGGVVPASRLSIDRFSDLHPASPPTPASSPSTNPPAPPDLPTSQPASQP